MAVLVLEGFEELAKKLAQIQTEIRVQVTKEALKDAGEKVRDSASELAPGGQSGLLRSKMDNTVEMEKGEPVGYVFSPMEYAAYVEYGTGIYSTKEGRQTPWVYCDEEGNFHFTRGQHPQPFLYPALMENQKNLELIMAARIKKFVGD